MLKLAVLPSLNGQADERISYYDEGGKDSTKGTVLLLHDILNPDFLYHKVVIRFAELGYRIIAPTLSDQDNLGLAVDKSFAQVQLVLNLLSSLDITGPVKLIGHGNAGGKFAVALAAEFPQFVERLVVTHIETEDSSSPSSASPSASSSLGTDYDPLSSGAVLVRTLVLWSEEDPWASGPRLSLFSLSSPSMRGSLGRKQLRRRSMSQTSVGSKCSRGSSGARTRRASNESTTAAGNELALRLSFNGGSDEDEFCPAIISFFAED